MRLTHALHRTNVINAGKFARIDEGKINPAGRAAARAPKAIAKPAIVPYILIVPISPALQFRPPMGLPQEHAESGYEAHANGLHGALTPLRVFKRRPPWPQVPLSSSTPKRASAASCRTAAGRMCSFTSRQSSAQA